MDFQEIKHIIEKEGGKIVIVENDKPRLVVMSYAEWQGRFRSDKPLPEKRVEPEQTAAPQSMPSGMREESNRDGLTIDDLPL